MRALFIGKPCPRGCDESLLLAWIVSRIDEINATGPRELDLDHRLFTSSPDKVYGLRGRGIDRPSFDDGAFRGIELLAYSEANTPADHRYDFGIWVAVRRNF